MPASPHPAYEELLLLESGELDRSRVDTVSAHVAVCQHCRDLYSRVGAIRSIVSASESAPQDEPRRRAPIRRLARPAIAAGTAAAIALYLLTQGTPSARADEILARAAVREGRNESATSVLLQSGDAQCYLEAGGRLQVAAGGATPDVCASLTSALETSGWRGADLLSASKFRDWRQSLVYKVDSIIESSETTQITTTTTQGALRSASLEVRTSDYLAVAARYELVLGPNDRAAIAVSGVNGIPAELPRKAVTERPPEARARVSPPPPKEHATDSRDELEAAVRLALHAARADGDLQLAVDRRKEAIRVWGVVRDDEVRRAILKGLEGIPGVQAAIATEPEIYRSSKPPVTPWIAYQGDSLPLAHQELDELFRNNPEGRQQWLNDLDASTRRLLGAAASRDDLRNLASRLEPARVAADVRRAADDFDPVINQLLERIAQRLEPLLGPAVPGDGGDLTQAEAKELYELAHQTAFLTSGGQDLTLEQALERIAALLD